MNIHVGRMIRCLRYKQILFEVEKRFSPTISDIGNFIESLVFVKYVLYEKLLRPCCLETH